MKNTKLEIRSKLFVGENKSEEQEIHEEADWACDCDREERGRLQAKNDQRDLIEKLGVIRHADDILVVS